MWAISKQKVENFFDRMTRSMNLDTKKILTWYSYILFIAPLLFWALIALRSGASDQSIKMIVIKQPAVAIVTIIGLEDLLLRKIRPQRAPHIPLVVVDANACIQHNWCRYFLLGSPRTLRICRLHTNICAVEPKCS